ncbi:CrcB-like protein-domain-containing protein [Apodospora peruviana]|uniref:CrcB-like protein-domain-containing protein n=1 Tax=Apodospora peruviana TaxID=516989 RepID=A0AAE0M7W8_9PEZI|nr:CrcB-like protein-domain-containing protein [Apodospora peruviana]
MTRRSSHSHSHSHEDGRRDDAAPSGRANAATHSSSSGEYKVHTPPTFPEVTRRHPPSAPGEYNAPESYLNIDEVADVSPVQNPDEELIHRYESVEEVRSRDQERIRSSTNLPTKTDEQKQSQVSKLATQIYTVSYLIIFSTLGTLARLGLQALAATYPGAPVIFPSLWPNFAGCLVMGFLSEDRNIFRHEWGTNKSFINGNSMCSNDNKQPTFVRPAADDEETASSSYNDRHQTPAPNAAAVHLMSTAEKKAHSAIKKTIPLYIGLATGFCGSFTSFSAFMRDMFLALSNDLTTTTDNTPRNGGYSLAAVLAVLIITLSMSLSGLFLGAHLAIALDPILPSLSFRFTRTILDRLAVFLGLGTWLGAVLLCIFPPDRFTTTAETENWRGAITFSLAFAPVGCLLRFYTSLRLNGRMASFPLGTFVVNVGGTAVLAMAWDIAHTPWLGGSGIPCQILQGIEDGFCGCLTTVSTWVSELTALRRRHAYTYGGVSVAVGLGLSVAIMGGMRWSRGFGELVCVHSF